MRTTQVGQDSFPAARLWNNKHMSGRFPRRRVRRGDLTDEINIHIIQNYST